MAEINALHDEAEAIEFIDCLICLEEKRPAPNYCRSHPTCRECLREFILSRTGHTVCLREFILSRTDHMSCFFPGCSHRLPEGAERVAATIKLMKAEKQEDVARLVTEKGVPAAVCLSIAVERVEEGERGVELVRWCARQVALPTTEERKVEAVGGVSAASIVSSLNARDPATAAAVAAELLPFAGGWQEGSALVESLRLVAASSQPLAKVQLVLEEYRKRRPHPLTRPEWIPDQEAARCQAMSDLKCKAEGGVAFGVLMRRRHHCRACGKVVCAKCLGGKMQLPWEEDPQQVCRACLVVFSAKLKQAPRGQANSQLVRACQGAVGGRVQELLRWLSEREKSEELNGNSWVELLSGTIANEESNQAGDLDRLPTDLLALVFEFLNGESYGKWCAIAGVCRVFHRWRRAMPKLFFQVEKQDEAHVQTLFKNYLHGRDKITDAGVASLSSLTGLPIKSKLKECNGKDLLLLGDPRPRMRSITMGDPLDSSDGKYFLCTCGVVLFLTIHTSNDNICHSCEKFFCALCKEQYLTYSDLNRHYEQRDSSTGRPVSQCSMWSRNA